MVKTPTSPQHVMTPGHSRTEREERRGANLYQELSFQDADALGEMDEGADLTGYISLFLTYKSFLTKKNTYGYLKVVGCTLENFLLQVCKYWQTVAYCLNFCSFMRFL